MGRRSPAARFMPDVWVFPGGALEPALDQSAPCDSPLAPLCAAHLAVDSRGADGQALAQCALRETEEETGLTLARRLDHLKFFFRAITPPSRDVRFDARFFIAPSALLTSPCDAFHTADGELKSLVWLPIKNALSAKIAYITRLILEELAVAITENGADKLLSQDHAIAPLISWNDAMGGRIEVLASQPKAPRKFA